MKYFQSVVYLDNLDNLDKRIIFIQNNLLLGNYNIEIQMYLLLLISSVSRRQFSWQSQYGDQLGSPRYGDQLAVPGMVTSLAVTGRVTSLQSQVW